MKPTTRENAESLVQMAAGSPRVALQNFGCRLNQSETTAMAASLNRGGYSIVGPSEPADVVIINSCSVTALAEADCRKHIRAILRRRPDTFIAVTGCYAQVGHRQLAAVDGVDLIVGNDDKPRIAEIIDEMADLRKRPQPKLVRRRPGKGTFRQTTGLRENDDFSAFAFGQTRANLKIQDGCDVGCSFCIIPQTRGAARSRDVDDTLREARLLLARGHRELVLTGVNLGSYRDGSFAFADLLESLLELPDLYRLRISSIEPTTVSDEVLRLVSQHPKACRYLHVPVQSGDDAVLENMRRPYRRRDFEELLHKARRLCPDICLGTDVMVGFPGEDEAAFARTRDLVSNAGLSYLHVFSYSKRPGTRASRATSPVPRETVRQRSRCLHDVDGRLRLSYGRRFVGRQVEVLFEECKKDGLWVGLTDRYLRVAVPRDAENVAGANLENRSLPVHILRPEGSRWLGEIRRRDTVPRTQS